jgi:hypothetical protein
MVFQMTLRLVFILIFGFLLHGYIWQALDREEFPHESLPHWFVWLFR